MEEVLPYSIPLLTEQEAACCYPPPARKRTSAYRRILRPYIFLSVILFGSAQIVCLFCEAGAFLLLFLILFAFVSISGLLMLKIVLPFYDVFRLKRRCTLEVSGKVVSYDAIQIHHRTLFSRTVHLYAPIVEVEINGVLQQRIVNDYTKKKLYEVQEPLSLIADPDGYEILPQRARLTHDGFSNVCSGALLLGLCSCLALVLYVIILP